LVGDTKPRHYSIASAQSAVGDRVDLLVVTVEWTTPNGRTPMRYLHDVPKLTQLLSCRYA
jgi:sulfite reductase alpha subunit-like flavoprotein